LDGGSSAHDAVDAAPGSADLPCRAGATFCSDFESGNIPAQAALFPSYQRALLSTYLSIDDSVAHSGTHSLRVTSGTFSQMLGVDVTTDEFWTRVYLRSDLGTPSAAGHDAFTVVTDGDGEPSVGEEIRLGENFCQLDVGRGSDDTEVLSGGTFDQCSAEPQSGGLRLTASRWYCLEAYYDGPAGEVRVFLDGIESTPLHVTGWPARRYRLFKFGFEAYRPMERTVWFDDVAVGPRQIGCD